MDLQKMINLQGPTVLSFDDEVRNCLSIKPLLRYPLCAGSTVDLFPSSFQPSNGLKCLATIENRVLYAV